MTSELTTQLVVVIIGFLQALTLLFNRWKAGQDAKAADGQKQVMSAVVDATPGIEVVPPLPSGRRKRGTGLLPRYPTPLAVRPVPAAGGIPEPIEPEHSHRHDSNPHTKE